MSRILLRGATVITMVPGKPDAEKLDILVENDRIEAIDANIVAPDADEVDLSGRILIPGLVNAHLHSWQAALRCLGPDWTLSEYLAKAHITLSGCYTPEDMQIAGYASALNQINCGTTTVGDWCHNSRTPDHAEAAVQGLVNAGIRALFVHGMPHKIRQSPHPTEELDRLLDGTIARHPLLSLGMAIPGPQYSSAEVALADFRLAKERGLVVSMHQSGGTLGTAWAAVRDASLIGPKTNIVHGNDIPLPWLKTMVEAGATFSITPENELSQGHGFPITGKLLRLGSAPSLGTDIDTVVSGEILTTARIALAQQRGIDHEEERQRSGIFSHRPTISSKQALAWATIEGARALGLSDKIGMLKSGMQADIVAIDARALNLWPAHDPVGTALQASLANIEAVMIAGQWRKRGHILVNTDIRKVQNALHQSGKRLVDQLNSQSMVKRLRLGLVHRVVKRKLAKQS
jgi:5-methylthioadenosine/S-adenosylhomocysteine deaminase